MLKEFEFYIYDAFLDEEDIRAEMERFGPIKYIERDTRFKEFTSIHYEYPFSVYNASLHTYMNFNGKETKVYARCFKEYQIVLNNFPISKIPYQTTGGHEIQTYLYKIFKAAGDILFIYVHVKDITISYTTRENAVKAVEMFDGKSFLGKEIDVQLYLIYAKDYPQICFDGVSTFDDNMKAYFESFGEVRKISKAKTGNTWHITYYKINDAVKACQNIHPFGEQTNVFTSIPRDIFQNKSIALEFKRDQLKLGFPAAAVYKKFGYNPPPPDSKFAPYIPDSNKSNSQANAVYNQNPNIQPQVNQESDEYYEEEEYEDEYEPIQQLQPPTHFGNFAPIMNQQQPNMFQINQFGQPMYQTQYVPQNAQIQNAPYMASFQQTAPQSTPFVGYMPSQNQQFIGMSQVPQQQPQFGSQSVRIMGQTQFNPPTILQTGQQ